MRRDPHTCLTPALHVHECIDYKWEHRLHEYIGCLNSSRCPSPGKTVQEYAVFHPLQEGRPSQGRAVDGPGGLISFLAVRSRHKERCFGLIVSVGGRPVLGWTVRVA